MKIQMTTNFGCSKDVQSVQWFDTLLDAQDYCKLLVVRYYPKISQKEMFNEIEVSNVKGLTNLMSNVSKFKFEWV